jgi:nicotinamide-nucleotide amidase
MTSQVDLAQQLLARAKVLGVQIAAAESLTGGGLASALVDVAGASAVFKLGIVAYSNEVKQVLLGVPSALLSNHGAVSDPVARAMAESALSALAESNALDADAGEQAFNGLSIATTGVAGPTAQDDLPPGTVFIAVALDIDGRHSCEVQELNLQGDRDAVRRQTITAALQLALACLD